MHATQMDGFREVDWTTADAAPHFPAPGKPVRTATELSFDLDEWVNRNAYEPTPVPEASEDSDPSTPDLAPASDPSPGPSPTDSWDFVPTPTPTPFAGPTPDVATNTQHGDYFPSAATADEALGRTTSKKRPSRTQTGLSALMPARKKSSRQKKIEGGFPCRENCGQCFNRECDERKHHERRHLPESHWPHECTHCPKKSQYPKDVWRHLEQTHAMVVPPKVPKSLRQQLGCPCCSQSASDWLAKHNDLNQQPLHIQTVQSPVTESTPSSPTSPNILWTLTSAITKLRRLSLKSRRDKFIMVTTDKQKFTEVDVSGLHTTEALLGRIASTLAFDKQRVQEISVHKYTRRSVGDLLTGENLLAFITQYADAEGSLKLFVKP
ncbi:uncharacterized protein MYCFIDRAFT_212249 [Pseudocercospora fijiensis CIRAD86]|uniref:C2H2-type domain-containing protein n=1 Tax=Pseudocercospora fijiensis (strain CIRAD86) TaxID=383855 RepID=M3AR21_PSEFD|nr:uncharacterized protein MYCFIDRAFT_212249 [Pseudocercospora fijiensis CIRAD86]EME79548.1 hypothetical protein MYCFIDRAFT_212249 [Pseudocercospora fijiensis CIRAD86]